MGAKQSAFAELARPHVPGLLNYEPGRPISELARELGLEDDGQIDKLASNENALGPSPLAVEAMQRAAAVMHLYPDGGAFHLKRALAAAVGVDPECLLLTNGSNEAIELLGHVYLGPGTSVVVAEYAFVIYRLVAAMFEAESVVVPMQAFTHDLEAMHRAIRPDTRLVFVANPNNPTGTRVDNRALDAFLRELPEHVIAVVDEAYIELLPLEEQPDTTAHLKAGRNVVILRTFSKVYGLAGLRIGYALAAPEGIAMLQRVRQPFNVNAMAQIAALAALGDVDFVERTRRLVRDGLAQLSSGLAGMGLDTVPSAANFLLVNVGRGRECCEALQHKHMIARPMDGYGLPEYIRVTVGTREQNERLLAALGDVLTSKK